MAQYLAAFGDWACTNHDRDAAQGTTRTSYGQSTGLLDGSQGLIDGIGIAHGGLPESWRRGIGQAVLE